MNYQELLRKYMDRVVCIEGTNVIDGYNRDTTFSEEEWAELERIASGNDSTPTSNADDFGGLPG